MLVANNGIGAVKFMRSVRSWAYKAFGSERAVTLVAMATPEDMRMVRTVPAHLTLDANGPLSPLCDGGVQNWHP